MPVRQRTKACKLDHSPKWEDIQILVRRMDTLSVKNGVYGIPTGGSVVAALLCAQNPVKFRLLESPEPGCLVVDDIIDSGKTLTDLMATHSSITFTPFTLYARSYAPDSLRLYALQECTCRRWFHFPWEHEFKPDDAVVRLLQYHKKSIDKETVDHILQLVGQGK